MKRLYQLYLNYSGGHSILFALLLVRHGAGLAVPFVFGTLIALLSSGDERIGLVQIYAGVMVLLEGISVLAEYYFNCRVAQETSMMAMQLKAVSLQRFQNLDYETRERICVGEWEQRVAGDSQSVANCSCPIFSDLHGALVMFSLSAGLMLWSQPLFLIPIFIIALLFRWVYRANKDALLQCNKEMRECHYRERGTLLDMLSLMPIMRLFQVMPFLNRRYDKTAIDSRDAEIAVAHTSAGYTGQIRGLMWLSATLVLLLSLVLYERGVIEIAEVVAYNMLIGQVCGQMGQLIFCIPALTRGVENVSALESVFGNYTSESEINVNDFHALLPSEYLLKLEKIGFHYRDGERDILKDLDWCLERGRYVSVLGKNGEGKSTLIKLLLGELRATSGRLSGCMRRPGYVPQSSAVFCGTLADNLTLCNRTIPRSKVEEVITLTCLQELSARVGGLDGEISRERISGGELQRIGIARALLVEPDLLVVDEITNNLDISNKSLIFHILKKMRKHCAIVSITHDVESFADSDECLMLNDGKLYPVEGNSPREKREFAYKMIVNSYKNERIF